MERTHWHAAIDSRRLDHSIDMPRFDGVGDLGLFLQRFDMVARHYDWPEEEKLFRLRQAIQGDDQPPTRRRVEVAFRHGGACGAVSGGAA